MLTCKRVLQCESTCVAGEARTRAACVTSVLCTRVVVYRAQRGERGIGGGEDEAVAKPGAHIRNRAVGKSGNREIGNRESGGMKGRGDGLSHLLQVVKRGSVRVEGVGVESLGVNRVGCGRLEG